MKKKINKIAYVLILLLLLIVASQNVFSAAQGTGIHKIEVNF